MSSSLIHERADAVLEAPKVPKHVFLGVIWGGFAVVVVCCFLRFLARVRTYKKLFADDCLVMAALAFAFAHAVTWQVYAPRMYYALNVAAGLELPREDFVPVAESYFKSTLAVIYLFYSALWSVKLSFLLLFRRLGKNVRGQKALWWPVFGFTLATYFACIGSIQYSCLVRPFAYLSTHCTSPAATSFQQITLKLNCSWDGITDCLIIAVPISMLRGVQMKWQRKAALGDIFSLVVITMIFAIVRTAVVGSGNNHIPDSTWFYMWSAIEASIAIIVACLATFRNLFARDGSRHQPTPPKAPGSSNSFLRGSQPRNRMRHFLDTFHSVPELSHSRNPSRNESHGDFQPIVDSRSDSHDLAEFPKGIHLPSDCAPVDVEFSERDARGPLS